MPEMAHLACLTNFDFLVISIFFEMPALLDEWMAYNSSSTHRQIITVYPFTPPPALLTRVKHRIRSSHAFFSLGPILENTMVAYGPFVWMRAFVSYPESFELLR
jgi:hypothetical protein